MTAWEMLRTLSPQTLIFSGSLEEGAGLLHVVLDVAGQVAEHVLVDEHPGGGGGEAGASTARRSFFFGHGEGEQHDREEGEEELGQRLLHRRAGGDREHADVVVDGVHLVHAVEALGALVDVLALVE
jgi:hypothetical protein